MKATEILPIVTHYIIRCLILLTQAIPIRPLRGDFDAVYTWNIFLHLDVPMTHSGKFLSDEEKPRCNVRDCLFTAPRFLSSTPGARSLEPPALLIPRLPTPDSHSCRPMQDSANRIPTLDCDCRQPPSGDLLCKDKCLIGTFEDDSSTRQRCYHCLFANFRRLTGETSYSDTTVRDALRHMFDLEI